MHNMIQYCQDSLAINRHFHGADLFITMTANPNWPEIQAALLPGETASDRPDLVCRVFMAKVAEFITDITKNQIFGIVLAYLYTIEFQKHGLPHMHMILCLHPNNKLCTPEDVDTLISAEFPDKDLHSELYELVRKQMVHGPCGDLNPNSPCMENGQCTKKFPKPFKDQTTISEDSYASYRRHEDGRVHEVHGHFVDNRWVVPHC